MAGPPVPIILQAEVDADSFRLTNLSPTASLFRVIVYDRDVQIGGFLESHPNDMDVSRMTSRPEEDFTWWNVAGGWTRNRWTEWQWTQAPAVMDVWFSQFTGTGFDLGVIRAPIETGRWEGVTVPEPGAWALAIGAMACVVAWKRKTLTRR
jgi:hypothetical protein